MKRAALKGPLWAILAAFPAAALMACVYRFPIPFGGYQSGVEAVIPSLWAVGLYGIVGGFLVLALLGAVGGMLAQSIGGSNAKRVNVLCLGFSVASAVICVLLLAVLDKIIGPW